MSEIFYERGKKYNCRVHGKPYFRLSATINGKARQVYGDGEKDANKKIEELKAMSANGLDIDNSSRKIEDVFGYWLYNIKRVDKDVKPSSFARYDAIWRCHIEPYDIVHIKLGKLTSGTMQKYVTGMYEDDNKSTQTIKAAMKLWKMFTSWAHDEGYIAKDPCKNISIPGKYDNSKRVIETFTEEERSTLLNYMTETNYQYDTVIRLAFATGMRQGELLGLKWEDIGEDVINVNRSTGMVTHIDKDGNKDRYREVWDTKTINSVRTIPLLGATKDMLEEHRLNQITFFQSKGLPVPEFVFTTSTGDLIDPSSFAKTYRRLLKRAGIEYKKFHAIRHTFATEAIRRGVNVKDLQMLMGHSDIQTTYIYVQADEGSKRRAIEMMGELMA